MTAVEVEKKDWYAPGEIIFHRLHIEWLLMHYWLLKDGFWPPECKETGYEGKSSIISNESGAFEKACQMVAEIDDRMQCLNRTEYMVIRELYIVNDYDQTAQRGENEYRAAKELGLLASVVFGCKEYGLRKMSGWNRKTT